MSGANQWFKKGFKKHEARNFEEAEKCYQKAIQASPKHMDALYMLGTLYAEYGRYDEAEILLKQALGIEPKDHRIHNNLANVYRLQGKLELALKHFDTMAEIEPRFLDGRIHRASVWVSQAELAGDTVLIEKAENELLDILKMDPKQWLATFLLANVYKAQAKHSGACTLYQRVIAMIPNHVAARTSLAESALVTGDLALAKKHICKAYEIEPNDQGIATTYALVMDHAGDAKEALKILDHWVHSEDVQESTLVVFSGALLHANGSDKERLKQAMGIIDQFISDHEATYYLLFARADILDKLGDAENAFFSYQKANQLKAEQRSYDISAVKDQVKLLLAEYPGSGAKVLPVATADDSQNIFIVGMPRSASSLIEQILASHPSVSAIGEYPGMSGAVNQLNDNQSDLSYVVKDAGKLTAEKLDQVREQYMRFLPEYADVGKVIVDKALSNMLRVGLIMQMFPDARIICCERDLYATIMSCYFQNFAGSETDFSNDLDTLKEYSQLHQVLREHWQKVFPENFMVIHYHDVVKNPESQVQGILDFCGLDMHEDCLHFYKSSRYSPTRSYYQVRQPIYKTADSRYDVYRQFVPDLIKKIA